MLPLHNDSRVMEVEIFTKDIERKLFAAPKITPLLILINSIMYISKHVSRESKKRNLL